jgi:hypothetical protein
MPDELTKKPSPEEEELARKRVELSIVSEQLAEKELELEEIKISLNNFQVRYFRQVGYLYVELDEIIAQIAEAEALNAPNNDIAHEKARQARFKSQKTAAEFHGFYDIKDIKINDVKSSDEIRTLYRKIASMIHPDKTTDENARIIRTRLMTELNNAYDEGDINRMREILYDWENSPDSVTGKGIAADLIRVIRTISNLRSRISIIETEINQIKKCDMYELMIQVNEAKSYGRDLMAEMEAMVKRKIDDAKFRLDEIV